MAKASAWVRLVLATALLLELDFVRHTDISTVF